MIGKYQILRKPLGSDVSSTGLYTDTVRCFILFCYCAHQALNQNTMDDTVHHICNVIGFNILMVAAKWFNAVSPLFTNLWLLRNTGMRIDLGLFTPHLQCDWVYYSYAQPKMVQCGISTIHEFMAIEEDRNEDRFGIIHTTSVLM